MDFNTYIEKKIISEKILDQGKLDKIKSAVTSDIPLVDMLAEQKEVSKDYLLESMSHFYGIPSVNLDHYKVEQDLLVMIPSNLAEKFSILPLFRIRNTLMLAMINPSDVHVMDEIRVKTNLGVEPVIAINSSLKKAIVRDYNLGDTAIDIIDEIEDEDIGLAPKDAEEDFEGSSVDDEPIVKLVNLFISQGVRQRASDIHINPEEKQTRVRFRIDGVLHDIATPPKKFEPAILSRIKVLANLDIAEKRRPQDGRIKMKVDNKIIDLRVSTLPTIYGENVVMRVLDSSSVLYGLDEIGFLERDQKAFESVIRKPYGIILVTGPTGSGKTTTLYSALGTINTVDRNIITLEDPVEYNLHMVRQGQVNHKVGFDFATGLRAILRQDPDVIMVGEIRDGETAHIAIESALTGHLVFSTLHTNDSVGAFARLSDMGVEHFLLASSVLCVMAQRLLRKICPECKEEYEPPKESLEEVGIKYEPGIKFYKGVGCPNCINTGYKGRVGIYEILVMSPELRQGILKDVGSEELKKIAAQQGMKPLRDDGIEKAKMGVTTIEEVLRVTKEG